ncbi:motility associated factor glycosyltransferase family protein [Clostridium butyricum]|uniref:6-hydroxymethylpterin diphosphokinase MptE-like domain-containing protein n=1 Tax=Clostridium butyricum TaxID=1492 RepID=A0A2S7FA91_CLOBU|nr:6-hydroxymethylpterin diphosphokinase MptE-like protein [Clostridium butyricum]KHD15789.1 hypothetical protein OA81_08105 [Clostridium butyricum]PPV14670.1 hypothetical protein AWN73_02870 [Clostridium butyricum]
MYELEKAKDGNYTLKYDGKYIHSRYNPIKEAEQFVNGNRDLLNKNKILVYGVGLGYHINEILKRNNLVIYVFEWNEEIIKYCKMVNKNIFKQKNVVLIDKKNKEFYKLLGELLKETKGVLIHKQSLYTIKDKNEKLYNLLNDFSIKRQLVEINRTSILKYDKNYRLNKKITCNKITEFIEAVKCQDKPIIITAAGPSLDEELKYLNQYRERFIVFSVGSALRTLIENNIYPDAIFLIDGGSQIKNQFIEFENLSIPLCFSAYASNEAIKIYSGPKYIFNDSESEENLYITTDGSVAIAALDIATKCDPKEIIFLGQDLALINGKNHTKAYEKMHLDKKESQYKLIEVPGICGNMVKTIQSYILFKNSIERIINNNSNIKFVNCSRGALIRGTRNMNFKLFLEKELK